MDIPTTIAVITVSSLLIGAVVSVIKHFKAPAFKEEIMALKKELEDQRVDLAYKLAEFEAKLAKIDYNDRDIEELRKQLRSLEQSVEQDLNRFEAKLDRLLELMLDARR